MALYPFTLLDAVPTGPQPLDPGSGQCIPLSLAVGQRYKIDIVHIPGQQAQEWTARAWISTQPMGSPDPALPPFVASWQPNVGPGLIVISFHERTVAGETIFDIPADAGNYVLNILNLSNGPNHFSLTVTDTTATGS